MLRKMLSIVRPKRRRLETHSGAARGRVFEEVRHFSLTGSPTSPCLKLGRSENP